MNQKKIRQFACLSALAQGTASVAAQDSASDSWKWGAELYFWGASLGGETTTGGNVDVDIDDIIEHRGFGSGAEELNTCKTLLSH